MDRESGLQLSKPAVPIPPMVIYHGKGLYRSWFGADDDYADQTAPNQSKQPGGNLAYTLSTTVASYSHCFES